MKTLKMTTALLGLVTLLFTGCASTGGGSCCAGKCPDQAACASCCKDAKACAKCCKDAAGCEKCCGKKK